MNSHLICIQTEKGKTKIKKTTWTPKKEDRIGPNLKQSPVFFNQQSLVGRGNGPYKENENSTEFG